VSRSLSSAQEKEFKLQIAFSCYFDSLPVVYSLSIQQRQAEDDVILFLIWVLRTYVGPEYQILKIAAINTFFLFVHRHALTVLSSYVDSLFWIYRF